MGQQKKSKVGKPQVHDESRGKGQELPSPTVDSPLGEIFPEHFSARNLKVSFSSHDAWNTRP